MRYPDQLAKDTEKQGSRHRKADTEGVKTPGTENNKHNEKIN